MTQLKILISGAGIAGNTFAFWLSKLGHDVTVVERFSNLRATGLQVDLRGHGIEVMKRMGLEQAFRSKSAPEQGPQNFTTEYEIMRGDLCRLIYDVTKDRATYIFGTSVDSFEERDSSVEVRFTDGKTGQFDLWVGADGPRSRTRRMMLGPDTTDAFYPLGNLYVAYFTISRPIQEGEEYIATTYMAPGGRGIMTRRHNPHTIQVYLGGKTYSERLKNARRGGVSEEKEALAELFQGAGWKTEEILKSMKDADDFYCERVGLVKLESWSRGNVTLVGDAAYCPSGNTGMGTTCGIVGAYILAGEIVRQCACSSGDITTDNLTSALNPYERKFQPFMNQVQKGLLESEDGRWDKFTSTAFGIAILNCFVGIASLLRVNMGKWMLREEVKGWDLPDYEEMPREEVVEPGTSEILEL